MTIDKPLSEGIYELDYFLKFEMTQTEIRIKKILDLIIADNKALTEQLEKVQSAWIVAVANLGGAEAEVKTLTEENEMLTLHKLMNWKAKEDAEGRLAESEEKAKKLTEDLKQARETVDFLAEQATHVEKDREADTRLVNLHYNKRINAESRLSKAQDTLKTKKAEFTESEKTHKETFISLPANTREAMLEYFEMGRAVGVLNMIGWVEQVLGGESTPKGEFKAYLRCKDPSEQCGKCNFLKQCKELNPQSEFTKGEDKE